MRPIKFRAWDTYDNKWRYFTIGESFGQLGESVYKSLCLDGATFQQFAGLKDKNGKEIYEGDIFRIEEDTDDGTEFIYVVITWVQEWCMFCTLRVDDEYPNYLNNGLKELDEPLFWTYTLEDTNSRKHFLCGNIYDTPELLKL